MTASPDADQAPESHGDELSAKLGVTVVELSAERVVAKMPVHGNRQPFGVLHGGAYCAIGETLASMAANKHAGLGRVAFGIDLNATHHRSAREGWHARLLRFHQYRPARGGRRVLSRGLPRLSPKMAGENSQQAMCADVAPGVPAYAPVR